MNLINDLKLINRSSTCCFLCGFRPSGSKVKGRTVAPVAQVGPDDVFLRETEDAEPTASHRGIHDDAGVRHHVGALKQTHPETQGHAPQREGETKRLVSPGPGQVLVSPDVAHLRPVAEVPAVRGLVLPAQVPRVLPEQLHLPRCVSGVPQGVPQELSRSGLGLHCLQDGTGTGSSRTRDYLSMWTTTQSQETRPETSRRNTATPEQGAPGSADYHHQGAAESGGPNCSMKRLQTNT